MSYKWIIELMSTVTGLGGSIFIYFFILILHNCFIVLVNVINEFCGTAVTDFNSIIVKIFVQWIISGKFFF